MTFAPQKPPRLLEAAGENPLGRCFVLPFGGGGRRRLDDLETQSASAARRTDPLLRGSQHPRALAEILSVSWRREIFGGLVCKERLKSFWVFDGFLWFYGDFLIFLMVLVVL